MGVVISPERYAAMDQAPQRVSKGERERPADPSDWDDDEVMQFAVDEVHAYRAEKRAAAQTPGARPATPPHGA